MPDYRTIPPTVEGICRYSVSGRCCLRHVDGQALCPPGACDPPAPIVAREIVMRAKPVLYSPPGQDGPYYRRWRAWGICTADGTMAEITMDPDKAAVWKRGGHKVVDFVVDEPIDRPVELATDGVQGALLP